MRIFPALLEVVDRRAGDKIALAWVAKIKCRAWFTVSGLLRIQSTQYATFLNIRSGSFFLWDWGQAVLGFCIFRLWRQWLPFSNHELAVCSQCLSNQTRVSRILLSGCESHATRCHHVVTDSSFVIVYLHLAALLWWKQHSVFLCVCVCVLFPASFLISSLMFQFPSSWWLNCSV